MSSKTLVPWWQELWVRSILGSDPQQDFLCLFIPPTRNRPRKADTDRFKRSEGSVLPVQTDMSSNSSFDQVDTNLSNPSFHIFTKTKDRILTWSVVTLFAVKVLATRPFWLGNCYFFVNNHLTKAKNG